MATVKLEQSGVLHVEDGKLVLSDLQIDKAFTAMWGGGRQYGKLTMTFAIETVQLDATSPDMNGLLTERSEPA